jgi:hypothetical protein
MMHQFFSAFVCAISVLGLFSHALASQPSSISSSTSQQREKLSVTIYQQDLGLISEVRSLRLHPGLNQVNYLDVAETIDPSSVYIHFPSTAEQIRIIEQEFKYDLLTPQTLLQKYIGQAIELHEKIEGQVNEKITPAVLLSVGEPNTYRIGDQIHIGHPGRVVINKLPEEIVTRPTLTWLLEAEKATQSPCQISYLAQGLSWTAYYMLVLAADETSLALNCWVSIDNHSGASYKNASLMLLAGNLQRHPLPVQPLTGERMMLTRENMAAATQKPIQESPLFEYHLYTLAGLNSLTDRQIKQVNLIKSENVPFKKSFVAERYTSITPYQRNITNKTKIPIKILLKMDNRKEDHLGTALPQGKIRIFKSDKEHGLKLIGEDLLEHVPEGGKIKLTLGETSDITGEYLTLDYKKLENRVYQTEHQITLNNYKPSPVKVTIVEHPDGGDWNIIKSTIPFTKKSATTAEAMVELAAKSEVNVTYTITFVR